MIIFPILLLVFAGVGKILWGWWGAGGMFLALAALILLGLLTEDGQIIIAFLFYFGTFFTLRG